MKGRITVVSCGTGIYDLSNRSIERVMNANLVAGGRRLLDLFPDYPGETLVFGKDAADSVPLLVEKACSDKEIVILASGDGLFHGISKLVAQHACDEFNLECIPAPTAFQELFSRLNLAWDNARFFSIHSGKKLPLREILLSKMAVIYAGSQITASGAAGQLCEFFPAASNRQGVIAVNLGCEDEQIIHATLGELSEKKIKGLSILLVLSADSDNKFLHFPLGLKDDFYNHEDGLITSPEVRAVILSRLQLPYHGILWDIGAGSGSVGIEAAAILPCLEVYAVEKKNSRLQDIKVNVEKMGVVNHHAIQGEAPEILRELPVPNRIFIGGGGEGIISILEKCLEALVPGGIIVVSAVLLETISSLVNWRQDLRHNIITLDVAEENSLSGKYHYLRNSNRINIIEYRKEYE